MKRLKMMIELARNDADSSPYQISSNQLGEEIGCSQQTASRWLNKLEEDGLIERTAGPQGQIIEITQEGTAWLKSVREDINEALEEKPEEFVLSGELTSGYGQGGYYISQEKYKKQFEEKLGFEPFPGTLDIKLDEKSLKFKERIQRMRGIKIEGFETEERSFGNVKCFPGRIKEEEAALVLPDRTHHEENIIEIISPIEIREKYELDDGAKIEVEVKI